MIFKRTDNKLKRLFNVVVFALFGAVAGAFFGFLLGVVISEMSLAIAERARDVVPREFAAFLGGGFGAIVGSVVSSVVALRD